MTKLMLSALVLLPTLATAQGLKCPKGYQPYADRCISQRMADYISCVEASGGNRGQMIIDVREAGTNSKAIDASLSGKGPIVKGSVGAKVNRATEQALAKRWETRWFSGSMNTCAQVLDKPLSKQQTEKTVKRAAKKGAEEAVRKALPQTSGVLIPNSKPTPQDLPCFAHASPTDMILIYGNNVSFADKFPHSVIKVKDKTLLSYDKKGNGIAVSGKFFSRDNRIIAELKDNKFFINPNNYFRLERPDEHSLSVYDQDGNEALNVEYVNPSVIRMFGRFYLPGRPPIIIDENGANCGGFYLSRFCGGHAGGADLMMD